MKRFFIPCSILSTSILLAGCSSCTKPKQPSDLPHKQGWSLIDSTKNQDAQTEQMQPNYERPTKKAEEEFYKEYAKNPQLIGLATPFLNPPQNDSYAELTKWASESLSEILKGFDKLHPNSKLTDAQKVDALTHEIEDCLSQSQDLSGVQIAERCYFYNDMARYRLATYYQAVADHIPAMQAEIGAWEKFYHAFTDFSADVFCICIGGQGSYFSIATTGMTKRVIETRIADMRSLCQPQGRQVKTITSHTTAPLIGQIDASIKMIKEKGNAEYRSPMATDEVVQQACKRGEELKTVLRSWIVERSKFAATLDQAHQGFYNAQTEYYIKECCESLKSSM